MSFFFSCFTFLLQLLCFLLYIEVSLSTYLVLISRSLNCHTSDHLWQFCEISWIITVPNKELDYSFSLCHKRNELCSRKMFWGNTIFKYKSYIELWSYAYLHLSTTILGYLWFFFFFGNTIFKTTKFIRIWLPNFIWNSKKKQLDPIRRPCFCFLFPKQKTWTTNLKYKTLKTTFSFVLHQNIFLKIYSLKSIKKRKTFDLCNNLEG